MGLGLSPRRPTGPQESAPTSDRLKRAIERNRRKQLERAKAASTAPPVQPLPRASLRPQSLQSFPRTEAGTPQTQPRPIRRLPTAPTDSGIRPRATEALPPKTARLYGYLYKGIWLFHGYLLVQLALSQGGVIDFYKKQRLLDGKYHNLAGIEYENRLLEEEIELIAKNGGYQKRLLRDRLGLIAKDEFLVLFARRDHKK